VLQIVTIDELKEARRQGEHTVLGRYRLPDDAGKEPRTVETKIVNGEMEVLQLTRPIGEMIVSDDSVEELLRKVTLDVELGREEVPIVYRPVYQRLEDANFPEVFDAPWAMRGTVIFVQHFEGDEVKFGSLLAEEGPTARIFTYAAGFEYTEKMVLFNQTFNMEVLNRAFGEAYNALLNHLHLYPLVNSYRRTLDKALEDADVAGRPGTVLLAPGAKRRVIDRALGGFQLHSSEVLPEIGGIETVIYYDGWETQVGRKSYSYSGVPVDTAYLVRPKRGFKELIKYDLMVDAAGADLSRLIENQVVGRAYRGVFAAIPENVQEITLPS